MITIRPCSRNDLPVLRKLVAELHEAVRAHDPSLPPSESISDDYFAYLLSRARDTQGRIVLAVDAAGNVVGYVCVLGLVPPDEPDEGKERFAFIADLYVVPAYRQRGVGRLLVADAERLGRALGAPRIELNVLAGNRAASGFYRAIGYTERVVRLSKRLSGA